MLKLVKYEIRKSLTGIMVMSGILIALEMYYIISVVMKNEDHTVTSLALFFVGAMVAYFYTFYFGIATYSKELKSKTGYLTFMSPVSSFSIIGAKLLATFVIGIIFLGIIIIFTSVNIPLLKNIFPEIRIVSELMKLISENIGFSTSQLILGVIVSVADFLISFYATISVAYMAITLSSTLLQNKKYKGVVSVIFFFIITFIIQKIFSFFPNIYDEITNMGQVVISVIPSLVYYLIIAIAAIFVSGKFLDKKVSL